MTNAWITKVKAYQNQHGVSYKEALIACGKKTDKTKGGANIDPVKYAKLLKTSEYPKTIKKLYDMNIAVEDAKGFIKKHKHIVGKGKGKKQKGGFIPLAVAGAAALTGAISGASGFGINKLLGKIF
jgi:hypothetical protein